MRVLMLESPPGLLEERRRRGADRWDEVWEGVLHLVPPPSGFHQDVVGALFEVLRGYVRRRALGTVHLQVGVREAGSGERNYRVPDLVFLSRGRQSLWSRDRQWIEGGPDVAFEIRSPGDETDEKLPFYAAIGVRELVVIDRDTLLPAVFVLRRGVLMRRSPERDGASPVTGLRIRLRRVRRAEGPVLLARLELDGREVEVE